MSETTIAAPPAPSPVSESIPAASVTPEQAAPPQEGADNAQPEGDTPEGDQDQKAEKPRQRASERIGELYGRMKAAERERDQAIAEVQRLRQPVVSPEQWDSMSFDQQQAAQMRQAVRSERAEELAREAQIREQEATRVRAQMFEDRVAAVREQIPEIAAAVDDPSLPVSEIGARFIMESEQGPQVAYYLSQNRDEATRIARMDPLSQAYHLGKIEARINAAPRARKTSTAPAPVPTVAGGARSGTKDPGAMNMEEYVAWRRSAR
jgi:hypothetical protein